MTPTPMHVSEPDGPPRGGAVVGQEAFGLTSHISDVCDRFARAGYLAVAPAMFHREGSPPPVVEYDDIPRAIELMGRLNADDVLTDVDQALAVLAGRGIGQARCGIVGFCMGGTVAFHVGVARHLGAAVTFYGGGIAEGRMGFSPMAECGDQLRTPWLGLFGDLDASIPVDEVELLGSSAARSAVPTEIARFRHAQHGFHCGDRPAVFDRDAAADAWRRTMRWFDEHLDGQEKR